MSIASLIKRKGEPITFSSPSSVTADSVGGVIIGPYVQLGPDAFGWIQPASSDTIIRYNRRNIKITSFCHSVSNPGVKEGDRITRADGSFFRINSIKDGAGLGRKFKYGIEEHR